jgi:hypothetical protein
MEMSGRLYSLAVFHCVYVATLYPIEFSLERVPGMALKSIDILYPWSSVFFRPDILYFHFLQYRAFHLKWNLKYRIMCELWWQRCNKRNELFVSFYSLGGTYRTALWKLVKMFTIFSKTRVHLFQYVSCDFVCVSEWVLATFCWTLCLSSSKLRRLSK